MPRERRPSAAWAGLFLLACAVGVGFGAAHDIGGHSDGWTWFAIAAAVGVGWSVGWLARDFRYRAEGAARPATSLRPLWPAFAGVGLILNSLGYQVQAAAGGLTAGLAATAAAYFLAVVAPRGWRP